MNDPSIVLPPTLLSSSHRIHLPLLANLLSASKPGLASNPGRKNYVGSRKGDEITFPSPVPVPSMPMPTTNCPGSCRSQQPCFRLLNIKTRIVCPNSSLLILPTQRFQPLYSLSILAAKASISGSVGKAISSSFAAYGVGTSAPVIR